MKAPKNLKFQKMDKKLEKQKVFFSSTQFIFI